MPYIKKDKRVKIDPKVDELLTTLIELSRDRIESGDMNYAVYSLMTKIFKMYTSYGTICLITGVLENVKQEFYRKQAAKYEEQKITENGDV